MAEQNDQNNMNIQQIVAAVISNLNALPSSTTASSNSPSTRRFESSQDELGAAFQIPRMARNAEANNINGASASMQSTSSSTSISGTAIHTLSAGYSRYHNYSQGRARPRKGKEQPRSTTTGCFEKSGSQRGKGPGKKSSGEPTFKDVCLLPSPDYNTVPRMRSKAELIGQGLYIDAWSFDKSSNEEELKSAISALFCERLITDQGDEVG